MNSILQTWAVAEVHRGQGSCPLHDPHDQCREVLVGIRVRGKGRGGMGGEGEGRMGGEGEGRDG